MLIGSQPGAGICQNDSVAEAKLWNKFAHKDPYTYICTDVPRGDRQAFWKGGEFVVLNELLPHDPPNTRSAGNRTGTRLWRRTSSFSDGRTLPASCWARHFR